MTSRTPILAAVLVALSTLLDAPARADDIAGTTPLFPNRPGWFGLGLNIGNVETGVTAKLWASSRTALQAALGDGPAGNAVRLNLDLTFSPYEWRASGDRYALPFYVGLGGVLGHSFAAGERPASTEAGFRLPLGMSILVPDNPVELFFEIAPEFTVRDSSTLGRYIFYTDGAIGARYYL